MKWSRCCWLLLLLMLSAAAPVPAQRRVVMSATGEAALGLPRVRVQLLRAGQALTGPSQLAGLGLGDVLAEADGVEDHFTAYFDTGAGSIVISAETAARFNLRREAGAVYHEVGLHGETPMHVSELYAVALAGEGAAFTAALEQVRLQVNARPAQGMMAMLGEINVVGMPAIERFVVEVDPLADADDADQRLLAELGEELNLGVDLTGLAQLGRMLGGGTAVRLHPPTYKPRRDEYDYAIPLKLVDFNRYRNPADAGPHPVLARNPMLRVTTATATGSYTADWLLDTGAAASIISTAQAQALGLMDEAGNFTRPRAFTLPIGGIGGDISSPPGFILDTLHLTADDGTVLEYRHVHVLVHDVGTTLDDGTAVTLDGIFGANLLLPAASGLAGGFPTGIGEPPLRRFWIDTQRRRLVVRLAEQIE